MAQKRGDAWHVRMSDEFDSNLTNISDLPTDLADANMIGPALTFFGLAPRATSEIAPTVISREFAYV